MAGDREQNQALIGQYEEKNRQFTQEIGEKTARLQELRAENQVRSEEIRALGEEKLALEGQRNQADKDSRAKRTWTTPSQRPGNTAISSASSPWTGRC